MRQEQTNKKGSKSIGKRTYTLKELAKRNFDNRSTKSIELAELEEAENPIDSIAPNVNLAHIQEDLLECATEDEISSVNPTVSTAAITKSKDHHLGLSLSIELIHQLITKEIKLTANTIGLETQELQAWIDLQAMAPKQTLLTLLRIAREHHLDPTKEEVGLALYDDIHWQAYITVEGYSKILNQHPAFDGISFTQSDEQANGIPIWMECAIYRKDRSQPIVIREYFEEVKGEQVIWQKMPRRMLRHRVMQQCARLAIN